MMQKEPLCIGCPLFSLGHGFALTDGAGRNGVLIVAEALGEDEARESRPLVGRAGTLFNRMLTRTEDPIRVGERLVRDDFVLANIVNCRPPDNVLTKAPYEFDAIEHCKPYLLRTIEKYQPRAIFAMGNQPLRWFTGHWGIESLRGYRFEWKDPSGRIIPVVPSYHPSYIQRGNFEVVRVWQLDLLKALALSRGESFERSKFYICHPAVSDAERFAADYFQALSERPDTTLLSFDIETPYISGKGGEKDEKWVRVLEDDASWMILRISFSYEPYKAISIPWTAPYLGIIQTLLASSGAKVVWNRHFDVPRVAKAGAPAAGRILDGMELWHYLEPSLPMGLKYVATFHCPDMQPWKLMSRSDPEWYNAADSDTALRTTLNLIERCKREGRFEMFLRHVVDLGSVLDALTLRGIAVDGKLRLEERLRFEGMLAEEEDALQPLIPIDVKPKKIYKNPEERLKKEGQWVDGEMIPVRVALTPKEIERLKARADREAAKAAEKLEKLRKKEERAAAMVAARAAKAAAKAATPKKTRRTRAVSPRAQEGIGIGMGSE